MDIGKIHLVAGKITVNLDLSRFDEQFNAAQEWLGHTVLEDCKPYMPLLTGSMQQRSYVDDGGRMVVFPGPYARYQYEGRVMVDSVTGKGPMWIPTVGYRFHKGAKLSPTDRKLTYSQPSATDHWFDATKTANGGYWVAEVKRIAGGR